MSSRVIRLEGKVFSCFFFLSLFEILGHQETSIVISRWEWNFPRSEEDLFSQSNPRFLTFFMPPTSLIFIATTVIVRRGSDIIRQNKGSGEQNLQLSKNFRDFQVNTPSISSPNFQIITTIQPTYPAIIATTILLLCRFCKPVYSLSSSSTKSTTIRGGRSF